MNVDFWFEFAATYSRVWIRESERVVDDRGGAPVPLVRMSKTL